MVLHSLETSRMLELIKLVNNGWFSWKFRGLRIQKTTTIPALILEPTEKCVGNYLNNVVISPHHLVECAIDIFCSYRSEVERPTNKASSIQCKGFALQVRQLASKNEPLFFKDIDQRIKRLGLGARDSNNKETRCFDNIQAQIFELQEIKGVYARYRKSSTSQKRTLLVFPRINDLQSASSATDSEPSASDAENDFWRDYFDSLMRKSLTKFHTIVHIETAIKEKSDSRITTSLSTSSLLEEDSFAGADSCKNFFPRASLGVSTKWDAKLFPTLASEQVEQSVFGWRTLVYLWNASMEAPCLVGATFKCVPANESAEDDGSAHASVKENVDINLNDGIDNDHSRDGLRREERSSEQRSKCVLCPLRRSRHAELSERRRADRKHKGVVKRELCLPSRFSDDYVQVPITEKWLEQDLEFLQSMSAAIKATNGEEDCTVCAACSAWGVRRFTTRDPLRWRYPRLQLASRSQQNDGRAIYDRDLIDDIELDDPRIFEAPLRCLA